MDRYAVIGNPVSHSKSPQIHALFAQQTGQELSYEAVLAPLDGFADTVRRLVDAGFRGFNVTVPFKHEAFDLADRHGPRAARAKAVNTLTVAAHGALHGENTDGLGLVRDLSGNLGLDLSGLRIAVLGAGGAVRGVLEPLLTLRPDTVHIANRTGARAEALARDFSDLGRVTGGGLESLVGRRFDLVINATAAGLSGDVPPLPEDLLEPGAGAYDMMYSDTATAFVRWAQGHGAAWQADGLGMLVEQAAEAFLLWRGVRPDTRPVIAALRPGVKG